MKKKNLDSIDEELSQPENNFKNALNSALKFFLSKKELGVKIYKSPFLNDEPKCFSYSVDLSSLIKDEKGKNDDNLGSGTSTNQKYL